MLVAIALPLVLWQMDRLTARHFFAVWIVARRINFVERCRTPVPAAALLPRRPASRAALSACIVAHIGIAVFVVGVTMVSSFQGRKDVKLAPGQSVDVAGYHFTFNGVREVEGPNYIRPRATSISRWNSKIKRKMNRKSAITIPRRCR